MRTSSLFNFSFIIICIGLLHQKAGYAETNIFDSSLDELMNIPITISSKITETLRHASSSVYVFTGEQIELMGVKNVEELMNYVPGFQVYREGDRAFTAVRGLSAGDKVLVLINGQRINDGFTGRSTIITPRISIENIQQIEFIRGPGSALYGSNAFLGVVSITTRKRANQVTLEGGTHGARSASGSLSKKVGETEFQGFIRAYSDNGNNLHATIDGAGISAPTQDPRSDLDMSLLVNRGTTQFYLSHLERQTEGSYFYGRNSRWDNRAHSRSTDATIQHTMPLSENVEATVRAGGSLKEWELIYSPATSVLLGPRLKEEGANLGLDFKWKLSPSNTLSLGVLAEYFDIKAANLISNFFGVTPLGTTREINTRWLEDGKARFITSIYVEDKYHLFDSTTLSVGGRLDSYNDFGHSFNPRAAIVHSLPWQSVAKIIYGEAFRAPSFSDQRTVNNPVVQGNSDLNAEKVRTIELVYGQSIEPIQSEVTLTYFKNFLYDLIQPTGSSLPQIYQNTGSLMIQGVETEIKATPFKSLWFLATFTHFYGTKEQIHNNTLSASANYLIGKWNFNLSGLYRQRYDLFPQQGSYYLANARMNYLFSDGFRTYFDVRNLTDRNYVSPGDNSYGVALPQRGRMAFVGLEFNL